MLGVSHKSSGNNLPNSQLDKHFHCEVVTGVEIDRAIEIRRRVYIEEFGFDLGGHGPRDALDDRAFHLLVTNEAGEAVGSLRLIDALDRPFEIESFLDIGKYLSPGRHPAEITRLCVLAPYRRISRAAFVHLTILEGAMRLACQLGVTDFVASTRADL